MLNRKLCLLLTLLTIAASPAAFAGPISWTVWNACTPSSESATGTMGGVGVTYTGEIAFCHQSGVGNFNYFIPTSTYTSATVSNAPTDGGMIAISGTTATHTFTLKMSSSTYASWKLTCAPDCSVAARPSLRHSRARARLCSFTRRLTCRFYGSVNSAI